MKAIALDELRDTIAATGLGPADVELVNGTAVHVTLTTGPSWRAVALQRWTDVLTVADMTAGQLHKNDPWWRLHLRGTFPSGGMCVVTAEYHRADDKPAVQLIRRQIEQQNVDGLLTQLAALEGSSSE